MSEETPPRLRLKPKLASEPVVAADATNIAVPAPAPEVVIAPILPESIAPVVAASPAIEESPSFLRLRPKLAPASVAAANNSSAGPVSGAKEISPDSGALPTLKPQAVQAEALPSASLAPEISSTEAASLPKEIGVPSPFPKATANAEAPSAPLPAFHLFAASGVKEATLDQPAPPKSVVSSVPVRSSAFDLSRMGLVLGILILLIGGYFGYRAFPPTKSADPIVAVAATIVSAPVKLPSASIQAVAEMPAKLITKVQDTITAKRESEQSRIDPSAESRESSITPVLGSRLVADSNLSPSPVSTVPSPSLNPSKDSEAQVPLPLASQAFRAWVDSAKITSVLEGVASRAIINGRLARANELVDVALGIVLDHVDTSHRQIIFRDHSGALVGKPY